MIIYDVQCNSRQSNSFSVHRTLPVRWKCCGQRLVDPDTNRRHRGCPVHWGHHHVSLAEDNRHLTAITVLRSHLDIPFFRGDMRMRLAICRREPPNARFRRGHRAEHVPTPPASRRGLRDPAALLVTNDCGQFRENLRVHLIVGKGAARRRGGRQVARIRTRVEQQKIVRAMQSLCFEKCAVLSQYPQL